MDKEQFKAAALDSLRPFKEQIGQRRIALDLYEAYGLKRNVDSYQRRIRACFDPSRPEFFLFADVVNMMRMYRIHDPLHFQCDVLGFERPPRTNQDDRIKLLRRRITQKRRQLQADEQQLKALEARCQPRRFGGVRFSRR